MKKLLIALSLAALCAAPALAADDVWQRRYCEPT